MHGISGPRSRILYSWFDAFVIFFFYFVWFLQSDTIRNFCAPVTITPDNMLTFAYKESDSCCVQTNLPLVSTQPVRDVPRQLHFLISSEVFSFLGCLL